MDVAVLVNLRARRGSEAVARIIRDLLPRARIALTRTLDDARRWLTQELAPSPPGLLLAAGGDGTAVALLNELRALRLPAPPIGVLALGTGNAWARVTGAPRLREALRRVASFRAELPPTRHFSLLETEGRVAHFAGTGWDAELVSDYKAQLESMPVGLREANAGLVGYLKSLFTRTIPRHLLGSGSANVVLTNLGEPIKTVDARGDIIDLPHTGPGTIVYRGPASVAAIGTTPEWGFGFRAFPFADKIDGRISVRTYGAGVIEATRNMFRLWRGEHPMPKMHDFFMTHGRMDFDRDVPFQIGGDLAGSRRSFEFRMVPDGVDLLDWDRIEA